MDGAIVRLVVISIHALRKESDNRFEHHDTDFLTFQSTLSVRRATRAAREHRIGQYISIHALRKESDRRTTRRASRRPYFSIHALRKESDPHTWASIARI